ncbi:MAG: enoyl-CoA hydratase [SAR86 cluster bacterium]|uniref:Enoyl-CoA hydratase n=1 Tax=SAR86 cluster bacterium TaxID=2030880 RepID=A0A2A4MSX0_9GAMM|nr:MAG: enoyl-CoA hydratase [SAR86 cluster bacterium]
MSDSGFGQYGDVEVKLKSSGSSRVAYINLDNINKANALNAQLIENLRCIFDELAQDEMLRAVVLGGNGKGFSAGADISIMQSLDAAGGRNFITGLHRLIHSIRSLPVPVIGKLHGYCFGGALEMAAACDFRIGEVGLIIGMPEVKVGIPSVIEAALLPNLIGWGKTREMLLTGANFNGSDAYEMGFLQKIVSLDEMDDAIEAWLSHILDSGALAVRSQKALMAKWEEMKLSEAIVEGIEHFSRAYETDEPAQLMARRLK